MSNFTKKISSVPSTPRTNQTNFSSKTSMTSIIRRASNLLTQRTNSSGVPTNTTSLLKNKCPPLDGEIVFSKNNICVHPPSRLHSYTLHHPVYLCIKCQNSPQYGSTLILTWIPNSTLKNRSNTSQQTPPTLDDISSPKVEHPPASSTPRHSSLSRTIDSGYYASNTNPLLSPIEQEKSDERRLSSDDQYEDALDENAYQRQESVTSDLTEGPDEIVDEQNDVDDDAFDSMLANTQSSNPAIDDSLPYMKETNSWKNATNTYEDQSSINEEDERIRSVAEQFCGVFSVDLGKMRSLRLFYCDDTPTSAHGSGQLVIASCESQYKVLHFHNGGLDRLIEILNEWNLFAYEKSRKGFANCHQFNVVRPIIESTDLHPEEGCYHLITIDNWRTYMNHVGQIEDNHQLRKVDYKTKTKFEGVRLFRQFSLLVLIHRLHVKFGHFYCIYIHLIRRSINVNRYEIINFYIIKKFEHDGRSYSSFFFSYLFSFCIIKLIREAAIDDPEQVQFFHDVEAIIEKDVVRTDRSHPYFKGDDNPNLKVMK